MPKVRISATMETYLTWEGHVPDDVPEDERRQWIKENVDGAEFTGDDGLFSVGWHLGDDVHLVEEEDEE
jgi:hypothetical protein